MKAMILDTPHPAEERPLRFADIPAPTPGPQEVLIRVHTCGICHTDLHIMEGEITPPRFPIIIGHQVIGKILEVGSAVSIRKPGERVGVPWVSSPCGSCQFCDPGEENLCDTIRFTGFDVNGGLAEYMTAPAKFVYPVPEGFSDIQAAPLLCAGIIGYRALRISGIEQGGTLGLFGFGASAHVTIQAARHRGIRVFVFTRSENHRQLARELGAKWVGGADDEDFPIHDFPPQEINRDQEGDRAQPDPAPTQDDSGSSSAPHPLPHPPIRRSQPLDAAIIFAPAGALIPKALSRVRKGGMVILAGIHMDRIPEMPYELIYGERRLVSVANSTREDAQELLKLAAEIPIKTEVETFRLEEANEAYLKLKRSEIRGAGVIVVSEE